ERGDLVPAGLGGEDRAGLHRLAVKQHGAGAARGGVTADVRRGQVSHVAQEVHEQHPVLDIGGDVLTVDRDAYVHFASCIAAHTRSGVAGMSMWRTPRCATASTTAFCTAGVEPMVPASPMPLTPSGLRSVGVSLASSSKLGSSVALIAA